jgi:hypothetical protein
MSALANKQLGVGDLSVHLMQDRFLDKYEYKNEDNVAQLDLSECPYSYPWINHPSTLLLLKSTKLKNSI